MSAKHSFAQRDVVRLVAGGPQMIVEGPAETAGHVWCTWSHGRFHHGGSFDAGILVRVDGPSAGVGGHPNSRAFHTPRLELCAAVIKASRTSGTRRA